MSLSLTCRPSRYFSVRSKLEELTGTCLYVCLLTTFHGHTSPAFFDILHLLSMQHSCQRLPQKHGLLLDSILVHRCNTCKLPYLVGVFFEVKFTAEQTSRNLLSHLCSGVYIDLITADLIATCTAFHHQQLIEHAQ